MNRLSPEPPTRVDGKLNLICFPYAGGSPTIFKDWDECFGGRYNIVAATLPGRGNRIGQRPFENWADLLDDLSVQLEPRLAEPHVLFGHSFGGRIAFELVQQTLRTSSTKAVIISGCRSPQYRQNQPLMHLMSKADFKQAIKVMNGTPKAILENNDIMNLMLPAVRADMMLSETWRDFHASKITPPIHVILGRDDPIECKASTAGWSAYTDTGCFLHEVSGGHFNLDEDPKAFTSVVEKILEKTYATH